MQYAHTSDHKAPPSHIPQDGQLIPTRLLIKREDTARLAALGIYPHITAPGDAPLGYTDWAFNGTQYSRELAGTQAERDAAVHERYLDSLSCTPLQARLELIERGLWDSVMGWAQTQSPVVIAFFEKADIWRFRDPSFQAGITALTLTEAQAIEMMESAKQR